MNIYYIMNFFATFLIFIVLLFLYIHVNDQYKKSEDLEIYEMDFISNTNLQEVCNVRQPILFQFSSVYPKLFEKIENGEHTYKTESIEVKVRDVLDYWDTDARSVDPIILPFRSFQTLAKSDPKGHYFMEDNQEFLQDTDFINDVRELDAYLKPAFTIHSKYDCLMGACNSVLPLRYHTDYRKFLAIGTNVPSGAKITVKMTPWRSRKYLHPVMDYDNYEFWSRVNPWTTSNQSKYAGEMEKLKFLEFDVHSGYILYIPPYWWYSIKFSTCDTSVISLTYQTAMNVLSNAPDIARFYLQFHNTTRKPARTLSISTDNKSESKENHTE